MNLNLVETTQDWLQEWDALTADPWLSRKTNRQRRLAEHSEYVDNWLPHLKTCSPGVVIDVGPGCGELLEIARYYGHAHLGVDAPNGAGGMGDEYLRACKLMHRRQELNVVYERFLDWLYEHHSEHAGRCVAVNFRGSVEQVFSEFMVGVPHDEHHKASELEWEIDDALRLVMGGVFGMIRGMLRQDGVLLIHANGARNSADYDEVVQVCALDAGLVLKQSVPPRLHKWGVA